MQGKYPGVNFTASEPQFMVFDPKVVGDEGPIRVVWKMDVRSAGASADAECLLVDAASGEVVLHYSLNPTAVNRSIRINSTESCNPYAWHEVKNDSGFEDTPNYTQEARNCYEFLGQIYDFYSQVHKRNGLNGIGGQVHVGLRAHIFDERINDCVPIISNAIYETYALYLADEDWLLFGEDQLGNGWMAQDMVAHEFTHGVTAHESELIYYRESGAIDESFADTWGEWIDQSYMASNGDNDTSVDWLLGEDLPGG